MTLLERYTDGLGVVLYDTEMIHNLPSSMFPRKDTSQLNRCVRINEPSCSITASLVMIKMAIYMSLARKPVNISESLNSPQDSTRGTSDSITEIVPTMINSRSWPSRSRKRVTKFWCYYPHLMTSMP